MSAEKKAKPVDRFAADLRLLIGQASDRNATRELLTLNQQALGAFYATGDDRFRELANYACACVTRIRGSARPAPTRH